MKTKILLSIAMLIMLATTSCYQKRVVRVVIKDGKESYVPIEEDDNGFTDFGDGVYYYVIQGTSSPVHIRDEFGPAIANFIAYHKELKISSLTPNLQDGDLNGIVGYWIITEPKVSCPCDSIKQTKK